MSAAAAVWIVGLVNAAIIGYFAGRIITLLRRIDGELLIHRAAKQADGQLLVEIRDTLTAIRTHTEPGKP